MSDGVIVVLLALACFGILLYSSRSKRKFETEQRALRKERKKHLAQLRANKESSETQTQTDQED